MATSIQARGPRASDRHRVLAEMVTAAAGRNRPAGSRIGLCPDQVRSRPALSRRHARCHQLRPGQYGGSVAAAREKYSRLFPNTDLTLLFDVSHNTCKVEKHKTNGASGELFVHRKGATRAFGPGRPDLPGGFPRPGQPVLIGGSMGTGSYVLAGAATSERRRSPAPCHGAGRRDVPPCRATGSGAAVDGR